VSGRQRLDLAVVQAGLSESRARAQSLIMGGHVAVDGVPVTRPAALVPADVALTLVQESAPYVSRGGLKLRHALDSFAIPVAGKRAVDIGASTGGFTDVLLQAGVLRVFAIDVGYGQLAWGLRNDPRVVVMERTNIRHVESLPVPVELAVIDVSFISLRLVLPVARRLVGEDGDCISLIKPQFEAGRKQVGKKGVVRDPAVWRDVLHTVLGFAAEHDWIVRGLVRSPIVGPAGNVEFLAYLATSGAGIDLDAAIVAVI
jgi:23S rRNA (cytidine1920-2'-O)/16S rRNA (cytidine1409-2'-O)-methyltransferase